MAIDDAVRDFAAAMAVIADRAPAGAIVTTTHVWRVGRGKLHVDEDCAGLGDSVPRPVTVNLATTGAHRLCGKCWTHLPAGARRVQAAVTALDTAAQGLAAAERALASGDPRRLAVSAAWGLRRYAARARGYARDETQYNPALRAWATTIVAAAEELVPRAEALLAADPGREVRLAALAL
ncbi:MAG: hypothetical protein ACXVXG_15050, partial [Nocardioidaceae bacterium]